MGSSYITMTTVYPARKLVSSALPCEELRRQIEPGRSFLLLYRQKAGYYSSLMLLLAKMIALPRAIAKQSDDVQAIDFISFSSPDGVRREASPFLEQGAVLAYDDISEQEGELLDVEPLFSRDKVINGPSISQARTILETRRGTEPSAIEYPMTPRLLYDETPSPEVLPLALARFVASSCRVRAYVALHAARDPSSERHFAEDWKTCMLYPTREEKRFMDECERLLETFPEISQMCDYIPYSTLLESNDENIPYARSIIEKMGLCSDMVVDWRCREHPDKSFLSGEHGWEKTCEAAGCQAAALAYDAGVPLKDILADLDIRV